MPFGIGQDGRFVPYTRRSLIWITISAAVQLLVVCKSATHDNQIARNGQSYVSVVENVVRIMESLKVPHLIATWISMRHIAGYVSRWQQFEVMFSSVWNEYTLPRLRPWIGTCVVTVFAVLVASLVVLDEHLFKTHGSAWTMLSYFFSAYYAAIIVTFWTFHCIYIVKVSRLLHFIMIKEVFNCSSPDADKVRRVRLLWVELRGLLSDLVKAFSLPIATQVTIYFVMYIFSSYSLLNALADRQVFKIIGFISPWIWAGLVICLVIESYHKGHNEVVKHTLLVVFSLPVPKLPIATKIQIDLFIDSLLDKSLPEELSGFLKLDRTLTVSITSRLITFLIVLMQFDSRTLRIMDQI
nr:gustatory receptor 1 [Matsumurasca onukii]